MGVIKSVKNLWTGVQILANSSNEKSWSEDLMAVRNGNLESWSSDEITNPYAENYVVHRGLQILATNIAQVPFDLYQGEEKLSSDFELNSVLHKPNPYTSNFELWEATITYLFLYGEAFWYLNTNNFNIIREIYALHPKYMRHVQDTTYDPIKSWVYNDKIPMNLDEVVHFKLFNGGGVRGLSPLDTIKIEYATDKEAAELGKRVFKNGTKLSGVIEVDKEVGTTLEEMRRILGMWKQEHQGSEKAYKVGALLGGMKYRELGQTMADLEFIAGRDAIRDRILLVLGIHKAVVGVTDKIDRATADTALRSLWQTTLKPQTVRIQEKINASLLDIYYPGLSCKFDLTVVEELKKDLNDTLDAATKLWKMGYTRNEINTRLGLRMPEDDGDKRLIPRIMIPEDMAEAAAVTGRSTTQANDPRKSTEKDIPEYSEKKIVQPEASERTVKTQNNQLVKKLKNFLVLQRGKVIKIFLKHEKVDKLLEKEDNRLKQALESFEKKSIKNIFGLNSIIFKQINEIISVENQNKDEKINNIKKLYEFLNTKTEFIISGEDDEIIKSNKE